MTTSQDPGNFLLAAPRPVKTYHSDTYPRIHPSKFSGKGKTVLITGGATGIGWSISESFAETGIAKLVIVSRSPGPLEKAKADLGASHPNVEVLTYSASLTDATRMDDILKEIGQIDILVLSAAATHKHTAIAKIPLSEIRETFETNVIAPFGVMKSYLALPKPAGGTKTVIKISSNASHLYIPHTSGYAASKAASNELMAFFADEYTPAKDGVRLFSIHPGAFYTPLAASQYPADAFPWEDVRLPGHFCAWLGLSGEEADFLHGRFVWAQWNIDELIALRKKVEGNPSYLKIGLVQ